jgi:SAM-dependent methyltransferase
MTAVSPDASAPAVTAAPCCRVCGSAETTFALEAELPFKDGTRRYFACERCGTLLDASGIGGAYDGGPSDAELTDREPNVKFFIEVGAGLDSFAVFLVLLQQALGSRAGARGLRLLDVGASFGFLVAMARSLGWDATGVEPSYYGRLGSRVLGVPLHADYLENTGLPPGTFDCIVSSEVIEHVADPRAFLTTVARYLATEGVLLLTTPNGEVLRGGAATEREWYDGLSPGQHLNLLSPRALAGLLAECGLEDVRLVQTGGSSGRKHIYALAARRAGLLQAIELAAAQRDARAVAGRYLEDLVADRERAGVDDPAYRGALFRLEQDAVNCGEYARAERHVRRIDALLERDGLDHALLATFQPSGFAEYVARLPAFLGLHYYYRGMLELNHRADPLAGARSFGLAARLCGIEDGLGVFPRAGWRERARFHEGLALVGAGRREEALVAFDELLGCRERVPAELRARLYREKVQAHLAVGDHGAIRRFLDELLPGGSADGDAAPGEMDPSIRELREMTAQYRPDRHGRLHVSRAVELMGRLRRRVAHVLARARRKAAR